MEKNTRLSILFDKYLENSLRIDEWDDLVELIQDERNNEYLKKLLSDYYADHSDIPSDVDRKVSALVVDTWKNMYPRLEDNRSSTVVVRPQRNTRWIVYAAACLLIIGLSWWSYISYTSREGELAEHIVDASHILPGGNKAVLTLADGKVIDLSGNKSGIVIGGQNEIKYNDGTSVTSLDPQSTPVQHLHLKTPRGGNYKVVLPDGTEVWLNTASVLHYPSRFTGDTREVTLEGEAFFSVSKGKKPFIVRTGEQSIRVHGTKFNVNSYARTPTVTLVEGKVSVNSGRKGELPKLLSPGQQSVLVKDKLTVRPTNVQTAISWKDGLFFFREADVANVMEQLSMWYDVPVHYQKSVPHARVNGEIYKNIPLSDAITILNQLDISCYYDGEKLIVR